MHGLHWGNCCRYKSICLAQHNGTFSCRVKMNVNAVKEGSAIASNLLVTRKTHWCQDRCTHIQSCSSQRELSSGSEFGPQRLAAPLCVWVKISKGSKESSWSLWQAEKCQREDFCFSVQWHDTFRKGRNQWPYFLRRRSAFGWSRSTLPDTGKGE